MNKKQKAGAAKPKPQENKRTPEKAGLTLSEKKRLAELRRVLAGNSREQAKRMISKALNEGSSLDRSFVLANMLRTSTPDIQDEMLSILAEKDPAALHDPAMKFTGVQSVVDRFIKTDGELVKAAGVAMEKEKKKKSHQERIGILWDNFDNRHLRKKIEERIATTNDEELKDSYENMKEIKQEERQKAADRRG